MAQNLVDEMLENLNSASVMFRQALAIYGRNKTQLICFVEGYCDQYYSAKIDSKFGQNKSEFVDCKGRDNVLTVIQEFHEHPVYKDYPFAGFIDRDYHDFFVNNYPDRLYVTPCYSLENFYTGTVTFKKILKSIFRLNENGHDLSERQEFNDCVKIYQDTLGQFNENIKYFNYFAKAHRLMVSKKIAVSKLDLSDWEIKKILIINLGQVKAVKNKNITEFTHLFSGCDASIGRLALENGTYEEAVSSFQEKDVNKLFRGKQQIQFLLKYFTLLSDESNKDVKTTNRQGGLKKHRKVSISTSLPAIVSDFAQYAESPDCLSTFLDNLKTIITQHGLTAYSANGNSNAVTH